MSIGTRIAASDQRHADHADARSVAPSGPRRGLIRAIRGLGTHLTTGRALGLTVGLGLALAAVVGCERAPSGGGGAAAGGGSSAAGPAPVFTLAWSEYPSWSVFGVASDQGLINGERGKMGPIELRHNVDIELKLTDYDTCMTMYAAGTADAVCITNMDALNPALARPSVAVLATSTSVGGDALIVTGIADWAALRGRKVYGLAKTVSEYAFVRGVQLAGEDPKNFQFTNMDPAAAAQAMQTKQPGFDAVMVWNPFVLQTLRTRPDARVLFDSSAIPEEIIDMVVMSRQSMARAGGPAFAQALADAFYALNQRLADPATADATLVALGSKFSSLGLEDMREVVAKTRFYATPSAGQALFTSESLQATMQRVVTFCVDNGIVARPPELGFGPADATRGDLVFDPSFMQAASPTPGNAGSGG